MGCLLCPVDWANLGKNLFPMKICMCQQLSSTLLKILELLSLQQASHFYGDASPCFLNVPHHRTFNCLWLLPSMTLCFQLPLHHILIDTEGLTGEASELCPWPVPSSIPCSGCFPRVPPTPPFIRPGWWEIGREADKSSSGSVL